MICGPDSSIGLATPTETIDPLDPTIGFGQIFGIDYFSLDVVNSFSPGCAVQSYVISDVQGSGVPSTKVESYINPANTALVGSSPTTEHIGAIGTLATTPDIYPFYVDVVFEGGGTWSGFYILNLLCFGETLWVDPTSTLEIYAPK